MAINGDNCEMVMVKKKEGLPAGKAMGRRWALMKRRGAIGPWEGNTADKCRKCRKPSLALTSSQKPSFIMLAH